MDELAMAAWAHYLADIDADMLRALIDAWVMKESRAPSIADLMDRVSALHGTDGETAWQKVMRMVTGGGFRDRTMMGSPVLPRGFTGDLALEDAVKSAGGWVALARSDEERLVWAKKEFLAAYSRHTQTNGAKSALGAGWKELADGHA